LNFIDDVIQVCCWMLVAMSVIVIGSLVVGVAYTPEIKAVLLAVQSVIFGS
jgi:hypothetical protein